MKAVFTKFYPASQYNKKQLMLLAVYLKVPFLIRYTKLHCYEKLQKKQQQHTHNG